MTAIFSKLSDTELVEDPSYRIICRIALGAFLLSFLSALALIAPVLWIFPILGVGLGLVSLVRIKSRKAELSGEGLAKAAILLALPFAVFAPVRHVTRHQTLFRQARVYADEFFAVLLKGHYREAFLLSVAIESRGATARELDSPVQPPNPNSLEQVEFYDQTGPKADERTFRSWDFVSDCLQSKTKPTIAFFSNDSISVGTDSLDHVSLVYRATIVDSHSGRKNMDFVITLIRGYQKSARTGNWRVEIVRRIP